MKTQRGFTVVEGLLILIIVAILSGAGYYVWHSTSQTNKTLNAASNEKIATPAQSSSSSSSKQSFMIVKEWGVKIPLSEKAQDMYYIQDPDISNAFDFRTKKLDSLVKSDPKNCTPYRTLERGKANDVYTSENGELTFKEAYIPTNGSDKKIGEYYFIFGYPGASCSSKVGDETYQIEQALFASVNKLEAE